jgi:hypothetical protein
VSYSSGKPLISCSGRAVRQRVLRHRFGNVSPEVTVRASASLVEVGQNIFLPEISILRVLFHPLRQLFTALSEVEQLISEWLHVGAPSEYPQRPRFLIELCDSFHCLTLRRNELATYRTSAPRLVQYSIGPAGTFCGAGALHKRVAKPARSSEDLLRSH